VFDVLSNHKTSPPSSQPCRLLTSAETSAFDKSSKPQRPRDGLRIREAKQRAGEHVQDGTRRERVHYHLDCEPSKRALLKSSPFWHSRFTPSIQSGPGHEHASWVKWRRFFSTKCCAFEEIADFSAKRAPNSLPLGNHAKKRKTRRWGRTCVSRGGGKICGQSTANFPARHPIHFRVWSFPSAWPAPGPTIRPPKKGKQK